MKETDISPDFDWQELNKSYLMARLECLRLELEIYISGNGERKNKLLGIQTEAAEKLEKNIKLIEDNNCLTALDHLTTVFRLSPFEQNILLMCAGIELNSEFRKTIQGENNPRGSLLPTFGLALSVFGNAYWSALLPESPLRYWQLIHVMEGELLTTSQIQICESVLHFLAGLTEIDQQLQEYLEPVAGFNHKLTPSQLQLVDEIEFQLKKIYNNNNNLACLKGERNINKFTVAKQAFSNLGYNAILLSGTKLPKSFSEIRTLSRILNREAAIHKLGIFLECERIEPADVQVTELLRSFISDVNAMIILGVDDWVPGLIRPMVIFKLQKPTSDEQLHLWKDEFAGHEFSQNGYFDLLVSQFDLGTAEIQETGQEFSGLESTMSTDMLKDKIWRRCLERSRPKLSELAQQISPRAEWDDLVLPETQKEMLMAICKSINYKRTVYEKWGFSAKNSRGLGISALFSGDSGTGKTMAAEVLAGELKLDLFRVDLSQVVNKYIGETEKNLKKIFDAAEFGGAILLFDEADALFGKRSDVKDSHDRYANVEVSYLLQRMEEYRGLAILTTNMKNAIDKAFLRRLKFIIQFPFPDQQAREAIWKRIFPEDAPMGTLDFSKLGRLNISGGNIRNIAINAAFFAADDGNGISMDHIRKAARLEYAKMEKQLSSTELI